MTIFFKTGSINVFFSQYLVSFRFHHPVVNVNNKISIPNTGTSISLSLSVNQQNTNISTLSTALFLTAAD